MLFTAIPPSVDHTKVIAFLHNHKALINLSPLVTSYNETGSDGRQVSYDIRERVPVLPAGLWNQEIRFSAVFENREQGLYSKLHAPMGLVSEVTYDILKVENESSSDVVDEEGREIESQWVMKETIDSSVNVMFKSFVDSSMVPTRRKMAKRLMVRVAEGSS